MSDKKTEYTEEQKETVLNRVKELGNLKMAAEEAGIPWQLVSMWRKKADPSATTSAKKNAARAEKPKASKTRSSKADKKKTDSKRKAGGSASKTRTNTAKSDVKDLKSLDVSIKKDAPASRLQIENAVLKNENQELKAQVAKLKKALQNLI